MYDFFEYLFLYVGLLCKLLTTLVRGLCHTEVFPCLTYVDGSLFVALRKIESLFTHQQSLLHLEVDTVSEHFAHLQSLVLAQGGHDVVDV